MFQAPKLTDAGKNLYYRIWPVRGSNSQPFSWATAQSAVRSPAMTALVSAVVTIDAAVKNNAEQYADVSGHFSNAELEEGFYWREIGVFAADPDYPMTAATTFFTATKTPMTRRDFIPVASVETVEKTLPCPLSWATPPRCPAPCPVRRCWCREADLEGTTRTRTPIMPCLRRSTKNWKKKQDTITAKGIFERRPGRKGNPTVTKAAGRGLPAAHPSADGKQRHGPDGHGSVFLWC